jgi:predicted nucleic acid-binding protein
MRISVALLFVIFGFWPSLRTSIRIRTLEAKRSTSPSVQLPVYDAAYLEFAQRRSLPLAALDSRTLHRGDGPWPWDARKRIS